MEHSNNMNMDTTKSAKLFIKKINHWIDENLENEEKLSEIDDILAETFEKILKVALRE